jgi:hypothetical protein
VTERYTSCGETDRRGETLTITQELRQKIKGNDRTVIMICREFTTPIAGQPHLAIAGG